MSTDAVSYQEQNWIASKTVEVARAGKHQIRNVYRLGRGLPVTTPPFGGATLDADDVRLARQWLERERTAWSDKTVVERYESKFAEWNGSAYAYTFMAGRVALSAAIQALGLGEGDEVILPGYTCVVVPNAFSFAGVRPVYVDIELETYGPDVESVHRRITDRTKAILIQHLYGLVCRDYEELLDLADRKGLRVIEDCAHATGASYRGQKVGNRGDIGFYSTENSKVFNTVQGGVAVTNDDDLAERLQSYYSTAAYPSDQWTERQLYTLMIKYFRQKHPCRWILGDLVGILYGEKELIATTEQEERGCKPPYYQRKMPAPIAAVGRNQLRKIDVYNERRREAADRWAEWCQEHGYSPPHVIPRSTPVFLRYPVLVEPEKKQDISWALRDPGVTVGRWFRGRLHPVDKNVGDCPNADRAVKQCINFPTLL